MSLTYAEWIALTTRLPKGLIRNMRIKILEDDITQQQLIMSLLYAYSSGQIKVKPNPVLADDVPSLALRGVLDEYRVFLTDQKGSILNPLPFPNSMLE